MRVMVTGGSGFLGTHLRSRLGRLGWEVFAPGRATVDLCKASDLEAVRSPFDVVIHLAAWTQAGDWCLAHPGEQWIVNQQINTNVVSWWHERQQGALFVGMGTSCSYAPGSELTEDNYLIGEPTTSLYTYAMTKRMLLQGLMAVSNQYGGRYLYPVPSTLYGPGYHTDGRPLHFIFDLVRKILRGRDFGEPVILWGDGFQRRELVHVDDFITNLLALMTAEHEGVFNLGAGSDASIRDFAELICGIAGFPSEAITYDASRYVGARSKVLDIGLATHSISPYVNRQLTDGISDLVGWFEETGSHH